MFSKAFTLDDDHNVEGGGQTNVALRQLLLPH